MNCEPVALMEAAKCFCVDERIADRIDILLLCLIAGGLIADNDGDDE